MIQIHRTTRRLPYYAPSPLTDLPLLYQPEHLFPYTSFGDTAGSPVERDFRMVVMENQALRVEVAPELGGRVYRLFDKRAGKNALFSNPVVRPVRYLPIWAFISGGIEFNFPIAHSPTSIATVGCTHGQSDDYGFIRVGEREARTGMQWVVELGLYKDEPVLIQRSAFSNPTVIDHPWMSWTICAVPATGSTEFVHRPHDVIVHDHRIVDAPWPGDGLNWNRHHAGMTALFFKPGGAACFGAFEHDAGIGLMHLADPAALPGKKIWTYGVGSHRQWALATTDGRCTYAEIESGPLLDQGKKPMFAAGTELRLEEYWVPVHTRAQCDALQMPQFDLPPMEDAWLGWEHSPWQCEWEAFATGAGPLPQSHVPTGLELEDALRAVVGQNDGRAAEQLALWLAFRGRADDAIALVASQPHRRSQWIAGLIRRHGLDDPAGAVPHLEASPLDDPIAVVKLDELYEQLGKTAKRQKLLADAPHHRHVIERRANLALHTGQPELARQLLSETHWPYEHQRYVRTELWNKACKQLDEPDAPTPEFLHEDELAQFGADWSS